MAAKLDTHYGTRSWWDGTVRTLCGLRLPAEARYVRGKATCPACLTARANGVTKGR
ncbi:hypothetical protein LWP59_27645 [Amycolatopsis acidiphila]|uniref:hypothetical protein n=1 Tax=Amycolatopsis acidiphila TaxID=715473 RepID=UPI001643F165|nr:hypothetical protein [Amycolatopsis acidiphila]UIJ57867.1 hypothetical protein LWP59_27525 [Amycolatopsis acidiphila]UIJ57890.1 hypothetical protein LWP59_27645 [Amycolatopsis acidiphila]GHG71311.1 hypothetical protein GCM10017788_33140 [Amycolatopsis acidiphila]